MAILLLMPTFCQVETGEVIGVSLSLEKVLGQNRLGFLCGRYGSVRPNTMLVLGLAKDNLILFIHFWVIIQSSSVRARISAPCLMAYLMPRFLPRETPV